MKCKNTKDAIFPVIPEEEFFGRQDIIEDIYAITQRPSVSSGRSIFLCGRPKTGKTEVLRRLYNRLFWEQDKYVPFYYVFPEESLTVYDLCKDYLSEFLRQYLGFIKKDPALIRGGISLKRLSRLLKEERSPLIASLIENLYDHIEDKNPMSAIKTSFSAPSFVSSIENAPFLLAIDDFHNVCRLPFTERQGLFKEIGKAIKNSALIHVLAGYSPLRLKGFIGSLAGAVEIRELGGLSGRYCEEMWYILHRGLPECLKKTEISCVVKELAFNPFYIKTIIQRAKKDNLGITDLKTFYSLYLYELISGDLHLFFSSLLNGVNQGPKRSAVILLKACCEYKLIDISSIESSLPCSRSDAIVIMEAFCLKGLISGSATGYKGIDDPVLKDFINILYRLNVNREDTAHIKGIWLWKKLRSVEAENALNKDKALLDRCKAVLDGFHCQSIPSILFDYKTFHDRFKDKEYSQIANELRLEKRSIRLPLIVGSALENIPSFSDIKHVILGYGFSDGVYKEGNESIWIVGCFFPDSLVSLEEASRFVENAKGIEEELEGKNILKWMISKEGFSDETMEMLVKHNVFASNMVQVYLIGGILTGVENMKEGESDYEFELVLPMVSETELVAARAVEEIAKKGSFDDNATNQIKMALIEACINAIEHSRVKDGKVYLRFLLNKERLTIYVENEGKDFEPALVAEPHIDEKIFGSHKRGFGIKLIKNLMDSVNFEKVNNYTRLKMVKYIKEEK